MWSLALSRPLALGLAWLPAPCTFTRVVRGYLRHAWSLEWYVVVGTLRRHGAGHAARTGVCAVRRGVVAWSCVFHRVRSYLVALALR